MDATVLEDNYRRTPTVLGHQLVDLLRVATMPAEAAAAGAPHMGLVGEPMAEVIAEAETTQTATSLASHMEAMTPVTELKEYDARSPPRQATTTASPPFLPDFAICFYQINSSLWGSPSTMRSKTQSNAQMLRPLHRKRWRQQ
jgi:hypothetical protein